MSTLDINPFFKSPLLILGILLGFAAAFLIISYSKSVVGGRFRNSFLFLSAGTLCLALGVFAVTLLPLFLPENLTNLLHDSSLTIGFIFIMLSAYNFKRESVRAEYILSKDKAKSDFINVVAHHFRTPLSIIQWQTERLDEEGTPSPEKIKETVLEIRENAEYLSRALNDIFVTLTIENNEVHLTLKQVLLWEIIEKLIAKLSYETKKYNVSLIFDRKHVPLAEISVDEEKVSYILRILLINAIHYSNPGSIVNITLRKVDVRGNGDHILCEIKDDGIGISKDEQSDIFKKFFRGKEASQKVTRGLGLGLYIAKNYTERHKGDIIFASENGKGSTFSLYLPIDDHKKEHAKPDEISG